MIYSYGTYKKGFLELFDAHDIYLLIKGTDGTRGSQGGENGVGGEKGYDGKINVSNPETKEDFPIKIISEKEKSGNDGEIGKSGKIGINGNDVGLMTCTSMNPHFYGKEKKQRLEFAYDCERKAHNRYDGYSHLVKKKGACYVSFNTEEIDQNSKRVDARDKRTTKRFESRAIAKANIISDEILAEAENIFGAEDTFLVDVCTEISKHKDDIEEEEEKQVIEEITVIKNRELSSDVNIFTSENDMVSFLLMILLRVYYFRFKKKILWKFLLIMYNSSHLMQLCFNYPE